jgi:hypothetical protein
MMTPRLFLLFCITLSFSTRIPLNAQSLQKGQTVDGYVAEVDGRIITLSDVIISTRQAMQELVQDHRGSRAELVRKQEALFKEGMEKLIDRKLMLAKFDKLEATLPPSAVRDQKERILRDRFQNNRAFLIQALRQTGMTELEWEQDMKENLIQQSMIQEFVQQRIQITPSEIRQAYEEKGQELQTDVEVHLRAIAFRPAKEGMEEERTLKIEAV